MMRTNENGTVVWKRVFILLIGVKPFRAQMSINTEIVYIL